MSSAKYFYCDKIEFNHFKLMVFRKKFKNLGIWEVLSPQKICVCKSPIRKSLNMSGPQITNPLVTFASPGFLRPQVCGFAICGTYL
jgi:hypothetical protein